VQRVRRGALGRGEGWRAPVLDRLGLLLLHACGEPQRLVDAIEGLVIADVRETVCRAEGALPDAELVGLEPGVAAGLDQRVLLRRPRGPHPRGRPSSRSSSCCPLAPPRPPEVLENPTLAPGPCRRGLVGRRYIANIARITQFAARSLARHLCPRCGAPQFPVHSGSLDCGLGSRAS
jgi:hypothetical protein